jgi:hypothetical protein
MSKLIGNDPNQVSSNADLGSAAFLDTKEVLLAKGNSLSAIDGVINKNVADVFIYDTSMDSDGGAWRKRCQHTSWYNEPLNTHTRGKRREFPSVAVIAVETTKLTIYDADDADLSMWMVFEQNNYANMLGENQNQVAKACNGYLALGCAPYDLYVVNFISDNGVSYSDGGNITGQYKYNIAGRNTAPGTNGATSWHFNTSLPNILSRTIHSLDFRVRSGAPISSNTGLPEPTLAVAISSTSGTSTGGGLSVIQLNETWGTVSNYTSSWLYGTCVRWLDDDRILFGTAHISGTIGLRQYVINYPSMSVETWEGYSAQNNGVNWSTGYNSGSGDSVHERRTDVTENGFAIGYNDVGVYQGLTLVDYTGNADTSLAAYIKHNFNTGWMPGDIVVSTLADTETGIIYADQYESGIIPNGYFNTDVSSWSTQSGSTITWNSGGTATVTSSGTNIWNGVHQGLSGLTPGKRYVATADIISSNNWGSINFTNGAGSAVKYGSYTSWNSGSTFPMKARAEFEAPSSTAVFQIDSLNTTNATVTVIDNIHIAPAETEHTVNENGLQVRGVIRKDKVAAGADIVAYSGFASQTAGAGNQNYLFQQYTSSLNFGTGDFCVIGWFKTSDQALVRNIASRYAMVSGQTYSGWNVSILSDGTLYLYTREATNNTYTPTSGQRPLDDDQWHHFVVTRNGTDLYVWVDGDMYSYGSGTVRNIDCDNGLRVGYHWGEDQSSIENLSMLRITKTIPTPDQIRKMYEDEKHLFQPNAKAVLAGDSNGVRAVSFDKKTKLLHTSTAESKSVFRRLTRVDDSGWIAQQAIDAHDGLVIEE